MKHLVRFFSFNSYVWLAVALFGVVLLLLLPGGLNPAKLGVLALFVAGAAVLSLGLRTPGARRSRLTSPAAFDQALRGRRPTLLELYSDHCGLCLAARPTLDRLEQEAGTRLQVLRLNVKEPLGAELADRYGVTLTPTFLLFNSSGAREAEFLLWLDRARLLYWLDQQTITP